MHLAAVDLAAKLVAGDDLEVERHAAAIGLAVGRDLVDDAIVVAGQLRPILRDVPLLALLLLVTAGDDAAVLPDPHPAHVGGRERGHGRGGGGRVIREARIL